MSDIVTPDLCDAFVEEIRVMQPGLQHYGGVTNFYGRVVSVACFEDNSKVAHLLRNQDGAGSVLLVDGGGSMRRALLGDMLAEAGLRNQWNGIIINGCIRDVELIKQMPIGVMALSSVPLKTQKRDLGDINVTVNVFGLSVEPGEYIYADQTGVIVSSRDLIKK